MTVNVTIRNVPDDVRDALSAKAAASGHSMQEYLVRELAALAKRPSAAEAILRARAGARWSIDPTEIREALDADRS